MITAPPDIKRKPVTSKMVVLLTTSMANFFSAFMGSAINIALPAISREFSASALLLGWMVTAYLLASAVFLVPVGRVSDMIGIKKVFLYGMVVYMLFSVGSMVSTSGEMLLTFRTLQGLGAAMIFGNTMAIITSVFPAGERGRALGILSATVYLGFSAGPFLGGLLTEHFGWRSIFLMNAAASVMIIVFTFWKIGGEWFQSRWKKFDLTGSLVYGATVICVMYGFSTLPSVSGWVLVLAGATLALVFIKWETRINNPVLEIGLFRRNKVFAFSSLAALLNYGATYSVTFLLSLYLQYIKGLSAERAGLVIVAQPVIMAVVSPLAGRLSDRIEPRVVASTGMAITSLGLFLLAFLSDDTSILQVAGILMLLGIGTALFASPNSNAIMSSVKSGFYGVASATLSTMRIMGQVFSMGITLVLFGLLIGPVVISPQYYSVFLTCARIAFVIAAALCIGGVFASLARGNLRTNGQSEGKIT